jgi:hypothetical protein
MKHLIRFAPQGSLMEYTYTATNPRVSQTFTKEKYEGNTYNVPGIELNFKSLSSQPKAKWTLRGKVKGFSWRSRSRLNKKMAMLKKHHLPIFLTLTYGEVYPQEVEQYKKHLSYFFKHFLDRKFSRQVYGADGKVKVERTYGAIWKLEYQERGAAHFHILLWGVPIAMRHQLVKAWTKITSTGVREQDWKVKAWHMGRLGNGNVHCAQPIRSWGGVLSYSAKYMAKIDDDHGHETGRIWGTRGNLPYSAMLEFKVDLEQALEFRYWVAVRHGFEFKRLGFWCGNYNPGWLSFLYDITNQPDCPDWDIPFEFDIPPGPEEVYFDG